MSLETTSAVRNKLLERTYGGLPTLKSCRRVRKHVGLSGTQPRPARLSTQRLQKSPPKLSLNGSTFVSPRRSLESLTSRQLTTGPSAKPVKYPVTASAAIRLFPERLSSYELGEILQYPKVYYVGNTPLKNPGTRRVHNWGFDDHKGNYLIVVGDHLRYRYEILNVIGKGSFGRVCKCLDHKRKEVLAVKVIRNKEKYHAQALVETKVLMHLNEKDPADRQHVVRVKSAFVFRNHICIAFELLSLNLYELIRFNQFESVSMGLARNFAAQILTALKFVHAHRIIHCDLKPENVLLSQARSALKVIDFGSSCFEDEIIYTYIQSRFYRAPEIMLGVPYTTAIDMWSIGCIVGELFAGEPLFPGESEQEQLNRYVAVLGLPPQKVIDEARRKHVFFEPDGTLKCKETMSVVETQSLSGLIKSNDAMFVDFIRKILVWDPAERLTAAEALKHPWVITTSNLANRRTHVRSSSFLVSY